MAKATPEQIKAARLAGGKRALASHQGVDPNKAYGIDEAVKLIKGAPDAVIERFRALEAELPGHRESVLKPAVPAPAPAPRRRARGPSASWRRGPTRSAGARLEGARP